MCSQKLHEEPVPREAAKKATKISERVQNDVWDRYNPQALKNTDM